MRIFVKSCINISNANKNKINAFKFQSLTLQSIARYMDKDAYR